jgi:hypothetical protein
MLLLTAAPMRDQCKVHLNQMRSGLSSLTMVAWPRRRKEQLAAGPAALVWLVLMRLLRTCLHAVRCADEGLLQFACAGVLPPDPAVAVQQFRQGAEGIIQQRAGRRL